MDKIKHCTLLVLLFVLRNAAQEPICKVSSGSKYTKYVVDTKLHPDGKDCLYSWNNHTNFVLASTQGSVDLVRKHTNTTLEMFKCMNVIYELNCMSGSTLETRQKITCVANCLVKSQSPFSSSCGHYSASITILVIIAMYVVFECF